MAIDNNQPLKCQIRERVSRDLVMRERRVTLFNQKAEWLLGEQCGAIHEAGLIKEEETYLAISADELTIREGACIGCVSADLLLSVLLFNGRSKCLNRESAFFDWSVLSDYDDINAQQGTLHGDTILIAAVRSGYSELVDFLLQNGACADTSNRAEECPLHVASSCGFLSIVKQLLFQCECDPVDGLGQTPLSRAVSAGHLDVVQCLISSGAQLHLPDLDGQTLAHKAVMHDNDDVLIALIDSEVEFDVSDREGATPLHLAASRRSDKALRLLLESGADVNAVDGMGNMPLHWALLGEQDSSLTAIALLLRHGADPFLYNYAGLTPVNVSTNEQRPPIVRALLDLPIAPKLEGEPDSFFSLKTRAKTAIWDVILDCYCETGSESGENFIRKILPHFWHYNQKLSADQRVHGCHCYLEAFGFALPEGAGFFEVSE